MPTLFTVPRASETPTTNIDGEDIQTVTVTASRLMDWPKFLLVAALFAAVLKLFGDTRERR